jgi:predicted Fe-S protein YdhL (DUF1289 family)
MVMLPTADIPAVTSIAEGGEAHPQCLRFRVCAGESRGPFGACTLELLAQCTERSVVSLISGCAGRTQALDFCDGCGRLARCMSRALGLSDEVCERVWVALRQRFVRDKEGCLGFRSSPQRRRELRSIGITSHSGWPPSVGRRGGEIRR